MLQDEPEINAIPMHLLCSTRTVGVDEAGQHRMVAKTREWDMVATGKDLVKAERETWEIAQQSVRVL